MKNTIQAIIIATLLIVIGALMLDKCNAPQNTIITKYDSIPYIVQHDSLIPVTSIRYIDGKDSILHDTTWLYSGSNCDSVADDFSQLRTYQDSATQDSSTKVLVTLAVRFNQLQSINYQIINFRPVSYETKKQVRPAVLLGATMQRSNRTNSILLNVGVNAANYTILSGVGVNSFQFTVLKSFNFRK